MVGYNEASKAYRIYVPCQKYIEVSRDVTFDEEAAFRRSREVLVDDDMEEIEAPCDAKTLVLDSPCSDV